MASWMWLNLVLGAVFILAIVGVPLSIVLSRPDDPEEPAALPLPVPPPAAERAPRTAPPRRPQPTR